MQFDSQLFLFIQHFEAINRITMVSTRSVASSNYLRNVVADSIQYIASFLTPRELYNVTYSNKLFCEVLEMSSVIQVAMQNGNERVRRSIALLYEQTSRGTIYAPSALRVLQLINVKKCEICCENKLHHVRATWGMALCWSCTQNMTRETHIDPVENRINPIGMEYILQHPRVLSKVNGYTLIRVGLGLVHRIGRFFIFDESHQHAQTRGLSGPIVTRRDIIHMCSLCRPEEVDNYIDKALKASPKSDYEEFNSLVRAFRYRMYPIILQSRNNRRREETTRKARMVVYRRAKVTRSLALIGRVRPFLDTRVADIFEHATGRTHFIDYGVGTCIIFQEYWITSAMAPYIKAPSKYRTVEHMHMIAEQMLGAYIEKINNE